MHELASYQNIDGGLLTPDSESSVPRTHSKQYLNSILLLLFCREASVSRLYFLLKKKFKCILS
jgi:hypothetical protein